MPLVITHKISRRKFLYAGVVVGVGATLSVDGFVHSNDPHLVRQEITLRRLPRSFDGFTIAHLSDFHYEPRFSVVPIRKALELVNGLRPDLIVLTGDFVTVPVFDRESFLRKSAQTAIPCAELLAQLQGPKYAILGNHDAMANPALIVRALEEQGIPVLRNRCLPIERGDNRIWLAGIDDLLRGVPRIDLTLTGIPADEATILLAHAVVNLLGSAIEGAADQILQHFDVSGLHRLGVDLDAQDLLAAIHPHGDGAAP